MSIKNNLKRITLGLELANRAIDARGGTPAENIDGLAAAITSIPRPVVGGLGTVTYYNSFDITWSTGMEMPITQMGKFSLIAMTLIDKIPYNLQEASMFMQISAEYNGGTLTLRCYGDSGEKTWTGTGEEAGIDTSMAEEMGMGWDNYYPEQISRGQGTEDVALESAEDLAQLAAEVQDDGWGNMSVNLEKTVTIGDAKFAYGYIKEYKFGQQYNGEYPDYFLCAYELDTVSGCQYVKKVGDYFMNWIRPSDGSGDIWESQLTSIGDFTTLREAGDYFMSGRNLLPSSFPALTTVGDYFGSERGGMGGGMTEFDMPSFPALTTAGHYFLSNLYGIKVSYSGMAFPELTTVGDWFMYGNQSMLDSGSMYDTVLDFPKLETTGVGFMAYCVANNYTCFYLNVSSLTAMSKDFLYCGDQPSGDIAIEFGDAFTTFDESEGTSGSGPSGYWMDSNIMYSIREIHTEASNPPADEGVDKCFTTNGSMGELYNPCVVYGSQADKFIATYPNDDNHYRWFVTERQYNNGEY